jgi:hypothetical protein
MQELAPIAKPGWDRVVLRDQLLRGVQAHDALECASQVAASTELSGSDCASKNSACSSAWKKRR